ncbi:PLCXD2 [Symbiodinium sp. CCMP2592]|nr:PLCXD2 [Symbiodinium sp. CCMP2592]
MAMNPKSMPTADRVHCLLSACEELKKRALKGTDLEEEKPAEDPEPAKDADAAPKSKPKPVKCEAATPKPRLCKQEYRSPGISKAGVADVQEETAPPEATLPPTLPTSPMAESMQTTPSSHRKRKRRASKTPKKTPEAEPATPKDKAAAEEPSSRTPKAAPEEPSRRTPKAKQPEEPSHRTPKAKAAEEPSSKTPKQKVAEEKHTGTPKENAAEEKHTGTPKQKKAAEEKHTGTPKENAAEEKHTGTPKQKKAAEEKHVNSSATWTSDRSYSDEWGWDWDQPSNSWSSWSYNRDWGSRGSGWSWSSWGNPSNEAKPKPEDAEASRVQSILQRGHTVDQLSMEELQLIVKHVDAEQQKKKAGGTAAAENPEAAGKKTNEKKQDEQHEAQDEKQEDAKEEVEEQEKVPETKEERRKRLHARNMRFYRSFDSPNCPKEIKKLSNKAKGDSSKRSFLFESWLTSEECWMKSSLLKRLRSKNSNAKRGLRRWLTKAEMEAKWGTEVAEAMIESKEADEERSLTEIRPHPELPHREDLKQYLCLWDSSEEDVDMEELECVFEAGPEDSSSSDSDDSRPKKKKKDKKKKEKKAKKAKKDKGTPSPKKPKAKAKAKAKGKAKAQDKEMTAEEEEKKNLAERKNKANKAIIKATEKIKIASNLRKEASVEGGDHLLEAMKRDVDAEANKVQAARAVLQTGVDTDEVDDDSIAALTAACEQFDAIHKSFQSRSKTPKGEAKSKAGKKKCNNVRLMPGSDDNDGDAANGLLQNILERVSNGAETVGSAMHNARASYEESGKHFKGKLMSKLVNYRPGNDAREFFKNVDVPTEVEVTIYEGFEGQRRQVQTTIPVMDVHEILDYLQTEVKLQCPKDKTRAYWNHLRENGNPFVYNFPAAANDLDCMVPFTLYGDELTLGKDPKDKVTGIFLQLTLFKPKAARQGIWLLAAIQDACMVHEELKTLTPILEHIVWSCKQAYAGTYPTMSRTGSALTGKKSEKAGQKFSGDARWVCAELRGDWKWHERTLRLLRTPVSKKCCFLCDAEASDGPLRYYNMDDNAAWRSAQLNTNAFLQSAIRPGQVSPLTLLTGFDVSMVKFCSMHVCNLGLVHTALLREGHFGPYNGPGDMKQLLESAYREFQVWRRANNVQCSQRSFAPRHLLKKVHGYYLTTKAYNARIVMLWLASKLQDVAQHAAATPSIRLHAMALTAFSKWFSCNEAAKRFLTPAQSDEIYDNGMLFLKCHLQLTQVSHRLKILAWVLKPKFHAMLHILDQSRRWRCNARYSHCFTGEDAMGWLKRVSLRAPRKPGAFNRWVLRMGMLKIVASKRRLNQMLGYINSLEPCSTRSLPNLAPELNIFIYMHIYI